MTNVFSSYLRCAFSNTRSVMALRCRRSYTVFTKISGGGGGGEGEGGGGEKRIYRFCPVCDLVQKTQIKITHTKKGTAQSYFDLCRYAESLIS